MSIVVLQIHYISNNFLKALQGHVPQISRGFMENFRLSSLRKFSHKFYNNSTQKKSGTSNKWEWLLAIENAKVSHNDIVLHSTPDGL